MSRVLVSIGAIQLLIMFVALVRAKVLSVLLGPAGFGVVSTIDQATQTAMQLAHLSLPFTALKFMSHRHSDGHEPFERTYASFFRVLLAVAVAAVLVLQGLLLWHPAVFGAELVAYRRYFALAFVGIPSLMLNVLLINTLAAAQRGAAGAVTNLVIGMVAAVSAIVGVELGGFGGLYLTSVIASMLTTAGIVWYLRRSLHVHVTAPGVRLRDELRESPEIVSFSLYVYIAVGAYLVAVLITRFYVFAALGPAGAGWLQALLSIALTVGAVMTPMSGLYLAPLLNRQMPVAAKLGLLLTLSAIFLRMGSVTFGGGLVMVPLIESEVVNNHHWLTHQEFADAFALGQITPGPVLITATFVGYRVAGTLGALVATISIFLPAFLMTIAAASSLKRFRSNEQVQSFLRGVAPAVVGLLVAAALSVGRAGIHTWVGFAIMLVAMLTLIRFRPNAFWVILGAGVARVLLSAVGW